MPFFKLSELEPGDTGKRHIETLEFWLRRISDEVLKQVGGPNYWEAEPAVIKKDIRERVSQRIGTSPVGRFPRWIDATLIEHQIDILYNDKLYREYFKYYFAHLFPDNFPSGREYLKFILDKCALVRNALYHSNPISVRQVEQVVCYTNDILDSIKLYYSQTNQNMDFNAPSILVWSDSLGRRVYSSDFYGRNELNYRMWNHKFRCGDRIKMMVEVDASFPVESYAIQWTKSLHPIIGEGHALEIEFDESWINEVAVIRVKVISDKSWHRYSIYDDELIIGFTVLPPLS